MNSRPPCKTVWDLSDRILASGELNFTRHLVKRALLINTSTLYTPKIRQQHRLQLIIRRLGNCVDIWALFCSNELYCSFTTARSWGCTDLRCAHPRGTLAMWDVNSES